jgi:hypothetical protein
MPMLGLDRCRRFDTELGAAETMGLDDTAQTEIEEPA